MFEKCVFIIPIAALSLCYLKKQGEFYPVYHIGGLDMTRNNAREIAVHMIFELGFSHQTADELLSTEMTPERFAQIGEEEPQTTLQL